MKDGSGAKLPSVDAEREYRHHRWTDLNKTGGPKQVPVTLVNDLRIFYGGRGIWVDKARSGPITSDGTGVIVGLLHTDRHYADDLSSDDVLYHYPFTQHKGRDKAEVDATKAAGELADVWS